MVFARKSDFFIGVDSDGTAFDSMKIKHTFSFIPAAVEVFNLSGSAKEKFVTAEEKINMYSLSRGINRFPGLYQSLLSITDEVDLTGMEDFEKFVNSNYKMSAKGLEDYIKENPSPFLEKVLKWSNLSDEYFENGTKNLSPFKNVKKALQMLHSKADIMVVSAASGKGLLSDWQRTNLSDDVDFIAGQEYGDKASQLSEALKNGYNKNNMLMLGDAPGDYEAAKKTGCCFYPIIPSREEESWELLFEKYAEIFFKGNYKEEAQEKLYNEFINTLKRG